MHMAAALSVAHCMRTLLLHCACSSHCYCSHRAGPRTCVRQQHILLRTERGHVQSEAGLVADEFCAQQYVLLPCSIRTCWDCHTTSSEPAPGPSEPQTNSYQCRRTLQTMRLWRRKPVCLPQVDPTGSATSCAVQLLCSSASLAHVTMRLAMRFRMRKLRCMRLPTSTSKAARAATGHAYLALAPSSSCTCNE